MIGRYENEKFKLLAICCITIVCKIKVKGFKLNLILVKLFVVFLIFSEMNVGLKMQIPHEDGISHSEKN